jgi:transposase
VRTTSSTTVEAETVLTSTSIHDVERRWKALLEYQVAKLQGRATHVLCDELAAKYGFKSGRTIRNLPQRLDERGTLSRKPGSGAPRIVSGNVDILEFFASKAVEWEYTFTYEAMVIALQEQFGVGSTTSVKNIMDHLEYTKKLRIIRPFLNLDHMKVRLDWANEWVQWNFFDENTVVVHIDEKCFYAFQTRGKVMYCPPGVDPEPFYALSKTQIPWCMFLGAVAAPRLSQGFDGKIGLWHVGVEKEALRRSKFHERGEVYWVNVNMDGDFFVDMVKTLLIPAILEKCSFASKIVVQVDSAGGHRILSSLGLLNEAGRNCMIPIEFKTQPCRSPDTNVLDLGTWKSMQSRVVEVKYDKSAEEDMNQRIINAVQDMWATYPSEKLTDIFHTLKAVLTAIKSANGGNSFKQPRKIKEVK